MRVSMSMHQVGKVNLGFYYDGDDSITILDRGEPRRAMLTLLFFFTIKCRVHL